MQSVKRPYALKTVPLLLSYGLAKLRPLHDFLPDHVVERLPLSWNFKMLSTLLLSRREKIYGDVYCRLRLPESFAPKVEVAPEHRMSEEELRFFWENGFSGPHTLFSPEEMAERRAELSRIFTEPSTIYPEGSYGSLNWVGSSARSAANSALAKIIINGRDKHLQEPALLDVMAHPRIRERVAQILGPDLLIWRTQYFPKGAGQPGTGWHQASVYLETMRRAALSPTSLEQMFQVTVWLAITDAAEENGCLRFVPGTHKEILPLRAELYDPQKHDDKTDHFGTYVLSLDTDLSDARAVNLPMKAGQFVIFSERVIHGALRNTSDQPRLALAARYITPETRVYNRYEFEHAGHDISYLGVFGLPLDRWRAVLVRGEDRRRVNGNRVISQRDLAGTGKAA